MRIAVSACVLVGVLSAAVRAEEGPPLQEPGGGGGPRIPMEIMFGGVGAIGGVATGFVVAVARQDEKAMGLEMIAGAAVGSWLGASITGMVFGGRGNWGVPLAGSLVGGAAAVLLDAGMLSGSDMRTWQLGVMVLLPVAGSVIGCEIAEAINVGPLRSVFPALAPAVGGKGAVGGIAGTF